MNPASYRKMAASEFEGVELPFDPERDALIGTAKQRQHGWSGIDTGLYASNSEELQFVGSYYLYDEQTKRIDILGFDSAVGFAEEFLGIDLTLWCCEHVNRDEAETKSEVQV